MVFVSQKWPNIGHPYGLEGQGWRHPLLKQNSHELFMWKLG